MVEITKRVHTIDGFTYPFLARKSVPYMFVENSDNLTLIDPSFLLQLPVLEQYILNAGYDIKKVKRIILTHLHIDHT
jgi:glyoxylase-like metal-dependent hydrolase (beta-lactamase superfamily II)